MPTSFERFGVCPDGNAPFDPQNEFTHKNLLYTARPLEDVASSTGRSVDEVVERRSKARAGAVRARARARGRISTTRS